MKKLFPKLFILCFLCSGCAIPIASLFNLSPSTSGGQTPGIQATTYVTLSSDNYRILKTNIVGTDWGITILGIFPIISPDYTTAIEKLYIAGEVSEGKPQAVVNILQQNTSPYFILFSIPRITFTADVVEFIKGTNPKAP